MEGSYIHTVEFYSSARKNEICRKMDEAKTITLGKVTQNQKDKFVVFSLICEVLDLYV